MTTQKFSVKEFRKELWEGVGECANEMGWDTKHENGRGFAFQLWTAKLFCNHDHGFDTVPEESLLKSKDLGADIVLEDTNRKYLLIAQCKYASLSKNPPLDERDVNDFFNRHEHFCNKDWVNEHGSEDASEFLGDYQDKIEDGYSVGYYFVSTGTATPRVKGLAENCQRKYKEKKLNIECHLIDFPALKEKYVITQSIDEKIPASVDIDLPKDHWFKKEAPHETVVATIKGNSLVNLYKHHKESLFAYNIRGYLGNRGINTKITDTAKEQADKFFYFNNGVSAICTAFEITGDHLSARDFQIINGAQTVGALKKAGDNPDIEVLFRLTRTQSVKTEKGMNIDIIRYNNSQNVIKTSDFHSNDPIQMWLEDKFRDSTCTKKICVLPRINYVRRRGKKKRTGRSLKLEDLAKIRYAFLFEPTLVHSAPKDLWTHQSEKGSYEKSFGDGQVVPELWSEEEFRRCLLAIAFYWKIDDASKNESKQDSDLGFLKRLRFHALCLAGLHLKHGSDAALVKQILENQDKYQENWEKIWREVRRTLIDAHENSREQNIALNALVRSSERWESMKKRYLKYITHYS